MSDLRQARKQTNSGRFYEIPGLGLVPSVTNLLSVISKPALIAWAANTEREMVMNCSADLYADCAGAGVPTMSRTAWITTMQNRLGKEKASKKELAKASEIGSQVHSLIEWSLRASLMQDAGTPPHICDKAQWAFMAWEDWRKSVKLKPIAVEQVVWSKTYGYAGTLDLLAEVNGELTVVDWKTGKKVYAEAFLQNAAYRHAVREMGHGDPKYGLIVRLPKVESDPDFEPLPAFYPEERCMDIFLYASKLWTGMSELEIACKEFYEVREPKKQQSSPAGESRVA